MKVARNLREIQYKIVLNKLNFAGIHEISAQIGENEKMLAGQKKNFLSLFRNKELTSEEKKLGQILEDQQVLQELFLDIQRMYTKAMFELKLDENYLGFIRQVHSNTPLKDLQIWYAKEINDLKEDHANIKKMVGEN